MWQKHGYDHAPFNAQQRMILWNGISVAPLQITQSLLTTLGARATPIIHVGGWPTYILQVGTPLDSF